MRQDNLPARTYQSRPASRRLLAFARPYWKEICLSVLLSVATSASSIGLMGTSAFLIATAALQPSIAALQVAIVGVRAFGIARGVFRYLERLVSHSVNFRLLAVVRGWFYRAVEPLVPGSLEDLKSGDLLARSIQDIETLEDFYVRGIAPPISAVVITLGMSLFTLQYSATLAALLAGGLILTGLVLSIQVQSLAGSRSNAVLAARSRAAALALEVISGTGEILMANAQNQFLERTRLAAERSRAANMSAARLHSAALSAGILISNMTLVAMLYTGIPLVRSGQIDGVTLAVLALITLASFEPINLLPAASAKIETSLSAANRLFSVADRPAMVNEPALVHQPGDFSYLKINNLTFTYPYTTQPALVDVSLDLEPGKSIALVGPSGSGKTTLLKIIQKYLPVDDGVIKWNGLDVNSIHGSTVRAWQAVVGQNAYVFSATLKENLNLSGAPEADFLTALEQVGLSSWYANLPAGMDTWLGDNASLLSGGERQRILLARALLMRRPILLADEPFSNLDPVSESAILGNLLNSSGQAAAILATHRLVGMQRFDEILVMDGGRIVQRGNHTDLVSTPGLYRQIWHQQNNQFFDA